jgi:protein gp37
MNRTTIDWPSLAYSWNPIVGCAYGCPYCYAKKLNDRFKIIPDWTKPMFFPERLKDPLKVKKPSTIFVGSMCDIFSKGVEDEWVQSIISVAKACPQHTFMFLTKKPEHYIKYTFTRNCMLGTTVDHKDHYKRLDSMFPLSDRKFISIEPILSDMPFDLSQFEVVIVGADKKPERFWVDSIKHDNIWYKQNIIKHYPDLHNEPCYVMDELFNNEI